MKHKAGTVCMALGIALLIAALSLFGYNEWRSNQAGQASDSVLEKLSPMMASPETAESPESENDMPEVTVDGQTYIGTLTIPVLDLTLPVMADWDYDKLQTAPCRYSGTLATKDLVIAGHNFIRHFGRLDTLRAGDVLVFTTMNDKKHYYTVARIETLDSTDITDMTAGEDPLRLFTCDYSGQARITVRCEAAAAQNREL